MVKVPAGRFLLGCIDAVDGYCSDESRARQWVSLGDFWIDVAEVSAADYRECVRAGKCSTEGLEPEEQKKQRWASPDEYEHTARCTYEPQELREHPINCVDWSQAKAYCEWAGKRLPTNAEWEKTARGIYALQAPYGDPSPPQGENLSGLPVPVDAPRVVGQDYYGARDLFGNVAEWTADERSDGKRDARGRSFAWTRIAVSTHREFASTTRNVAIGFRCAWPRKQTESTIIAELPAPPVVEKPPEPEIPKRNKSSLSEEEDLKAVRGELRARIYADDGRRLCADWTTKWKDPECEGAQKAFEDAVKRIQAASEVFQRGCMIEKDRGDVPYWDRRWRTRNCVHLARLLEVGGKSYSRSTEYTRPERLQRAGSLYYDACEAGDGWACNKLALLVGAQEVDPLGLDGIPDPKRLFERGCKFGEVWACTNLALLLERSSSPATPSTVEELLQRGCDGGDKRACRRTKPSKSEKPSDGTPLVRLGDSLRESLAQNKELAADPTGEALGPTRNLSDVPVPERKTPPKADNGGVVCGDLRDAYNYNGYLDHAEDCFRRGAALENPVPKLLETACSGNIDSACTILGNFYQWGSTDSASDFRAAAFVYEKACRGGWGESACTRLGVLRETGLRGASPSDISGAVKLYDGMCGAHYVDVDACMALARVRREVEKNEAGAAELEERVSEYLNKSCGPTFPFACELLGTLLARKEHCADAQKIWADTCKRAHALASCGGPFALDHLGGCIVPTAIYQRFDPERPEPTPIALSYQTRAKPWKGVATGTGRQTCGPENKQPICLPPLAEQSISGEVYRARALELLIRARTYFARATNNPLSPPSPWVWSHVGRMRETGVGDEKNLAAAGRTYQAACKGEGATFDPWACNKLAVLVASSDPVVQGLADLSTLGDLLERSCEAGDGTACTNMVILFRRKLKEGSISSREQRASAEAGIPKLLHLGCKGGDERACGLEKGGSGWFSASEPEDDSLLVSELGSVMRGSKFDEEDALFLTSTDCTRKIPQMDTLYQASICSYLGRRDEERAFELLSRACDAGDSEGCSMAAAHFERGATGSRRDIQLASVLAERAKASSAAPSSAAKPQAAAAVHGDEEALLGECNKARGTWTAECRAGVALACDRVQPIRAKPSEAVRGTLAYCQEIVFDDPNGLLSFGFNRHMRPWEGSRTFDAF